MSSILVVDDDSNQLNAVRRIFFDTPYDMAFLDDGRRIFEHLDDFKPDLVMLDLMMPGVDGYEICHQIKTHGSGAGPMVLIVSGKSGLEDRLKGYEVFADDFIAKPYEPAELKAKVLTLIRLKTAQDELRQMNSRLEELVQERTRELIKSERSALVGDMLHGIVHNFQSPLSVISSCIDMTVSAVNGCFDESPDGAGLAKCDNALKIKRNLELMQQAAERINAMIDGLLTHGTLNANDKKETVDLNEFIKGELAFLGGNMELKHKVLTQYAFDSDLPTVEVVAGDLAQVVANIVNNAVDAMRDMPRRELIIATHHDAGNVYVDFRDTGSGIVSENLDRIFDPFFTTKEHRDALEGGGGTGLGLHISLQLMKAMNGDIAVRNRAGEGAVFTLCLPRSAE